MKKNHNSETLTLWLLEKNDRFDSDTIYSCAKETNKLNILKVNITFTDFNLTAEIKNNSQQQ